MEGGWNKIWRQNDAIRNLGDAASFFSISGSRRGRRRCCSCAIFRIMRMPHTLENRGVHILEPFSSCILINNCSWFFGKSGGSETTVAVRELNQFSVFMFAFPKRLPGNTFDGGGFPGFVMRAACPRPQSSPPVASPRCWVGCALLE
jgi:hypothetical protein